jgi:hypothetical protein
MITLASLQMHFEGHSLAHNTNQGRMRIFGVFFCQRVKTGYMGVGEKCIPSD